MIIEYKEFKWINLYIDTSFQSLCPFKVHRPYLKDF